MAYPTEAVYGLGCDPWNPGAVARLLALKRRFVAKGLILLAAEPRQLGSAVVAAGPAWQRARRTWPGFHTWLLPARSGLPRWVIGRHRRVAVRVTAHPVAAALCRAFGRPLVSTSANLAGQPPARSAQAVRRAFPRGIDVVVPGEVGGEPRPSPIRDAVTGRTVRSS